MAPYFSLILPIYNVAPYLKRCMDSILSQNFKDYEIILVDDGSTDDSPKICDAYAQNLSNVRVIHKTNGGLSSARNAGLEIARGEYIWWIDSDDWIEPGALEQLHIATCKEKPDVIKFHYSRVEKDKQEVFCHIEPGIYTGVENISEVLDMAFYASGKFLLSAWIHVYRRTFLERTNIPFVSERLVGSEDYLFNLSVLPMAGSICVLPVSLYCYHMREGSLTQTYKRDLMERYERLYELLVQVHQAMGLYDQYWKDINFFFAWHLVRGTCITQEYQQRLRSPIREVRNNVRKLLASKKVQKALSSCDMKKLTQKQKIVLMAMKLKMESFFYYLFVIRPKSAD